MLAGGLVGLPLERWTRADSGWRRTGVAALAGLAVGGILGASLTGGHNSGLVFWGCALGALAALAGRAAVDVPLARNGRAVAVLVAFVLVVDLVGLVGMLA